MAKLVATTNKRKNTHMLTTYTVYLFRIFTQERVSVPVLLGLALRVREYLSVKVTQMLRTGQRVVIDNRYQLPNA